MTEINRDLPVVYDKPVIKKIDEIAKTESKKAPVEKGNAESQNSIKLKVTDRPAPYNPENHLTFDKPLKLDLSYPSKKDDLSGLNDLNKPPVKNPEKRYEPDFYATPEKVGAKYEDSSIELSIKKKGIKVKHEDTTVSVMLDGKASITKGSYSVEAGKEGVNVGFKTSF